MNIYTPKKDMRVSMLLTSFLRSQNSFLDLFHEEILVLLLYLLPIASYISGLSLVLLKKIHQAIIVHK